MFLHVLASALFVFGCSGGKDSGMDSEMTTGTTNTTDSGTTDTGTTKEDVIDSCDLGIGICIEYVNYAGTAEWCTKVGSDSGLMTTYSAMPCDTANVVGSCDIPVGGAYEQEAMGYYYSPQFDAAKAADTCTKAGGTPM